MDWKVSKAIVLVLLVSQLLIPIEIPYTEVLGEPTRELVSLEMAINISEASIASFIGENPNDQSGFSVAGAGDVNNDGYGDIIIGAYKSDRGATDSGQTYLIFGKEAGWETGIDLSRADASFVGENNGDWSGFTVSGAGDVNGDDYDDFIIGAHGNDEGGDRSGQVYLIFGRSTGFRNGMSLSQVDASFLGEKTLSFSGYSIAGAGDVNGDGFDDIIIGAPVYENYIGKTYLIFGRATGWTMDTELSDANASFIGEWVSDESSWSVSGAGDVNNDGFDDILIGAPGYGSYKGQTYLILGRRNGWVKDTYLALANASFIGENAGDLSGECVSGAGDVNGDGYDDIMIGARDNSEGGEYSGQTYLIFGKSSGWSMDTDLSTADASFWGEKEGDLSGYTVSGAGDVDNDGYDDIIIGSIGIEGDENDVGQTHLILGKDTGWAMDTDLSVSDASFIGERSGDRAGFSISDTGDVNGDGYDDIIIGAYGNDKRGGDLAGKSYLIPGVGIEDPLEVYELRVTNNDDSSILNADIGQSVKVKITGRDRNGSHIDKARVNVTFSESKPSKIWISLLETGEDTGIYEGTFKIPQRAEYFEIITFSPYFDKLKEVSLSVNRHLFLESSRVVTDINEDTSLEISFSNLGYNQATSWVFETGTDWIKWNDETKGISGVPDNEDIGPCWFRLNITDGMAHYDENVYEFKVINKPPVIERTDDIEIFEDVNFFLDLECDDEGQGSTEWELAPPKIRWIDLDPITGVLSGTPQGYDVGSYEIHASVDDGNGGVSSTEFSLTVLDVNDPPFITTSPSVKVSQGERYIVQFNADDEDDVNDFTWLMETNSEFLNLDPKTGELTGTPGNDDVGSFFVNISVKDRRGGKDWLNYSLEVTNVNDGPVWLSTPASTQINEGEEYFFIAEAIDVDLDDIVTYSISSEPISSISIDGSTGEIRWIGSIDGLSSSNDHSLDVEISATDGRETITHSFSIIVIPNPSPTSTILGPIDEGKITSNGILLMWIGEDDGEESLTYDIYLGTSKSAVSSQSRSVLWKEDLEVNSIHTGNVDPGSKYYWTVIPKDRISSGDCTNGVFSFTVNIPPIIDEIDIPEAEVGKVFELELTGNDFDTDELEFELVNGPNGMELSQGIITWAPSDGQAGTHKVNVSLSDGYETVYKEFEVIVNESAPEPDNKSSSIFLIFMIILIVLILAGAVVGLFLYLRNNGEEEPAEIPSEETIPEDFGPPLEEDQANDQLSGPP